MMNKKILLTMAAVAGAFLISCTVKNPVVAAPATHTYPTAGVIIDLDEKKPDFYELDITICLQSIWRLLLEHITYEPQASRENSLEYDRIKKILSYIEENYQNKITLNDIAGHIHLCESECTRLFKRHMNTTLFAFLQEYRIERSLEFLQDDQPVSAVADKAGFSDPNYYSKVFAKIKGCSPREYQKHRL